MTVSRCLRNKSCIAALEDAKGRKKREQGFCPEVENALFCCYLDMEAKHVAIDDGMLINMGRRFNEKLPEYMRKSHTFCNDWMDG